MKIKFLFSAPSAPTLFDKVLAVIFLPLIPKKVTPNQITIFRLIAAPVVGALIMLGYIWWGAALFIVAAFSDVLDGTVARVRGQITTWGKLYDPLADKLLIIIAAAVILWKVIGIETVIALVALELFIIVDAYRRKLKGEEIHSVWAGKIKMILQSFGVTLALAAELFLMPELIDPARYVTFAAIIFAAISIFVPKSV